MTARPAACHVDDPAKLWGAPLGTKPEPDEELPPDVVPPEVEVVDGEATIAEAEEVELPLPPAIAWVADVVDGEAKVGEAAWDEVVATKVADADEPPLLPPLLPPPVLPPPLPPAEQVSIPTVQLDPVGQQPPNSSLQQL